MFFWGAVFVLAYGATIAIRSTWAVAEAYGDTLLLGALGAACVINFARNRTLHCGMTGPLFLVGAVVAALIESDRWNLDLDVLWASVLAGVIVAFLLEWSGIGTTPSSAP
jgi:hypothetical protein